MKGITSLLLLVALAAPVWGIDIQAFAKLDSAVVDVGSSSIGAWSSLAQDMDPMPVLSRGVGGSILEEQLFYFNRIFKRNSPQICVLYCENNIEGSSVETIVDLMKYNEGLFHTYLPCSKLIVVSFKPSLYRAKFIPKMRQVNALLSDCLNARTNTAFVDVFTPMMLSEAVGVYCSNHMLHLDRLRVGSRVDAQGMQTFKMRINLWYITLNNAVAFKES